MRSCPGPQWAIVRLAIPWTGSASATNNATKNLSIGCITSLYRIQSLSGVNSRTSAQSLNLATIAMSSTFAPTTIDGQW